MPHATSYLLYGCAGVQVVAAATGICGFVWLNREYILFSFSVLLLAIVALGYVAAATYLWLRREGDEAAGIDAKEEGHRNLLLVFGIATVADFLMVSTVLFSSILYCMRRRALLAREHSAEMRIEYSDYEKRTSGSGSRRAKAAQKRRAGRRGAPEYLPSESL